MLFKTPFMFAENGDFTPRNEFFASHKYETESRRVVGLGLPPTLSRTNSTLSHKTKQQKLDGSLCKSTASKTMMNNNNNIGSDIRESTQYPASTRALEERITSSMPMSSLIGARPSIYLQGDCNTIPFPALNRDPNPLAYPAAGPKERVYETCLSNITKTIGDHGCSSGQKDCSAYNESSATFMNSLELCLMPPSSYDDCEHKSTCSLESNDSFSSKLKDIPSDEIQGSNVCKTIPINDSNVMTTMCTESTSCRVFKSSANDEIQRQHKKAQDTDFFENWNFMDKSARNCDGNQSQYTRNFVQRENKINLFENRPVRYDDEDQNDKGWPQATQIAYQIQSNDTISSCFPKHKRSATSMVPRESLTRRMSAPVKKNDHRVVRRRKRGLVRTMKFTNLRNLERDAMRSCNKFIF